MSDLTWNSWNTKYKIQIQKNKGRVQNVIFGVLSTRCLVGNTDTLTGFLGLWLLGVLRDPTLNPNDVIYGQSLNKWSKEWKMSKRSTILSQACALERRKQRPAVTNVNACVTKYHHWTHGIFRQSWNIFRTFLRGRCNDYHTDDHCLLFPENQILLGGV